jgi:hypothetical protein
MRTLLQDLRYSLRQLFQNPGFSLTALISLALGIGAATAVFSVLYSGLLHPYPYRGADNLVTPHIHDQQGGSSVVYLNGSQVRAIEQIPAIECVLATGYHTINLTGREVPENVSVVGVTGNTFSDLGIPAFLGRGILPSDVAEGHPPQSVAIISYEFWRRHNLSAPDILGRPLELDHQSYQIVGVAAPRFHWAYDGDIYLPLQLTQNSAANLLVYLRLKGGLEPRRGGCRVTAPHRTLCRRKSEAISRILQGKRRSYEFVHVPTCRRNAVFDAWRGHALARHRLRKRFDLAARTRYRPTV